MKRQGAMLWVCVLLLFTPSIARGQTNPGSQGILLLPLFPSYLYLPYYYPGNFYSGLPAGYSATGYMPGVGYLTPPSSFYYNPLGGILSQVPIGYQGTLGTRTYYLPSPAYGGVGYTNLWWGTYSSPFYGSPYYGGNYIGLPPYTPPVAYYSPYRVGIADCANRTLYLIFGIPLTYCSGAGSTPPYLGIPGFPFYIYLKAPASQPSTGVTPPGEMPSATPQPLPSTPSPGEPQKSPSP